MAYKANVKHNHESLTPVIGDLVKVKETNAIGRVTGVLEDYLIVAWLTPEKGSDYVAKSKAGYFKGSVTLTQE